MTGEPHKRMLRPIPPPIPSHMTASQSEQFTSLSFQVHTSPLRFPHAVRVPELPTS
ncbi:protein of unknown function [Blastococcus saxobsidens DD2]|uniref:Uncharacterized protein n=1 Tax=Blastococcus saxobsidens (strain DD2) TaxID=1146883 RepID=H6RTP2_BLASD|nr:protein of unknown function [Blastococcus saxobsidens DD2]